MELLYYYWLAAFFFCFDSYSCHSSSKCVEFKGTGEGSSLKYLCSIAAFAVILSDGVKQNKLSIKLIPSKEMLNY